MLWEFPLAYWMEKAGYDVSYISTVDTHAEGTGLLRAKGLLSVGHDEYWSLEMYNHVKAAIDAGVSVGFLSGDTCWGMIPFLPSGDRRVAPRHQPLGPVRPARSRCGQGTYPELELFEAQRADGSRSDRARAMSTRTAAGPTGSARRRSTGCSPAPA